MARNTHFIRRVFHANEDGTTEHRDVKFTLDGESGWFGAALPKYTTALLGNSDNGAPSLSEATAAYERAMADYSRKRLLANGEPVLLVKVVLTEEGGGFKSLTLGYESARRAGDRYYGADGSLLQALGHITVPDTTEHRAQVQRLQDSLQTAVEVLHAAACAPDPVAAFMAIGSNWQPSQPVAAKPEQPELPFNKPVEDEEL